MDFDKILQKCGDFGRYQYLLLGLFGFLNFFVSMHYFGQTMISFVPDHWCYHSKLENRTFAEIKKIYSKFDDASCTSLEDIINDEGVPSNQKCNKWIYDYDYGYESMTTELNWVCDSAYKSVYGQSFFFIGSVVGTLFYGLLADKFGRLPLLIIANMSAVIGDISTTFSTNVLTFSICRFVSGLAVDANMYLLYILVIEYIRPSKRIMGLNLGIGIFYSSGLVITPWIAVAVGNWKYYLLSITSPLILVITFYFLIFESAQWLVTQNDVDGAIKRLKKVAKFNGTTVDENDFNEFRKYCEQQKSVKVDEKRSNFFDLFRYPRLRIRTFILFYVLMVITLCYNIVARNVEGTGLSPFILFSTSSLTVFPAAAILIFLQNKIGRKGMATSAALFSGIIAVSTGIVALFESDTDKNVALLVSLQILARFGIALVYESGNQLATELVPTCIRAQAVALLHVAGYAISFLSAPILHLTTYSPVLPSLVLIILFFSEGFVVLFLPETLNKNLPKSMEEGENFSANERMFDFACLKKKSSTHL